MGLLLFSLRHEAITRVALFSVPHADDFKQPVDHATQLLGVIGVNARG